MPTRTNHWHKLHQYKCIPWNPKKVKNDYLRWKQKIPNSRTCPCKKNWAILDKANPPDFTSPDSFFFWGVDRHNEVNAELGKPILSHEEADMIHRNRVQLLTPRILHPLPERRANRAIITVAPDEKTQRELAITRSRMKMYAAWHQLDYIEVTKVSPQKHPCGNKYAYNEASVGYEQTLRLDPDIVIMNFEDNIFDFVGPGFWGMTDDLPTITVQGQVLQWWKDEWMEINQILDLPLDLPKHSWNSGMCVAPNNAIVHYHPPAVPLPNFWTVEQHYHNICLRNANVTTLPRKWNVGYWQPDFDSHLAKANFIHIGGCRPHELRLAYLEWFDAGNRELPPDPTFGLQPEYYTPWMKR